jgi:hypothetical protein
VFGVEDVHRSTTPPTGSAGLAEHFRHNLTGRQAARQCVAMLSVGGDDGVVGGQRLHDADSISLLADVEVQKAADFFCAVKLGTPFLKAPDQDHLTEQFQRMVAICLDFSRSAH